MPGFPGHPHRGFEMVTIVRKGMVDHADSLGAAGRYGDGDVQWMTAGSGVQHSTMFPLIKKDSKNPLALFQVWLNLPAKNKMVKPYFKMLWRENIPVETLVDNKGLKTKVEVIAGKSGKSKATSPPPDSRAWPSENDVAIWHLEMAAGAHCILPKAQAGSVRTLYFYVGKEITIEGRKIPSYHMAEVDSQTEIILENGPSEAGILILQGKPIAEPVIQYGLFVMNSKAEINQAFEDYHRTKFGGWPWPRFDQVHDRHRGRFAKYADGRLEKKNT